MSQVISEVIGVIEVELNAECFEFWLDDDVMAVLPELYRPRQDSLPITSKFVLANLSQLSDDLRCEMTRMLHRLLKSR